MSENRVNDTSFIKVLQNLGRNGVFERLNRLFRGEVRAMYYIDEMGEAGIAPSRLSERMGVSKARVTVILSTLSRKGYVQMVASDSDRRCTSAHLTAEGKAYFEHQQIKTRAPFALLIERMGEEDASEFIRLLRIVDEKLPIEEFDGHFESDGEDK